MAKRKIDSFAGNCGTCCHGYWVTDDPNQRDVYGLPILIRCEHSEHSVSRGMPACRHYKQGNKKRRKEE